MNYNKKLLLAAITTLIISGCGGGDSVDSIAIPAGTVGGTASAGALLDENLSVELQDAAGSAVVDCTETASKYSCDVTGKTAPYFIKATGNANGVAFTLYSAAEEAGKTTNVNPMTNLAVARAVGVAPEDAFKAPATYNAALTTNLKNKTLELRTQILAVLEKDYGFANADEDPFTANIVEGTRMDRVFDYLSISVNSGGGFTVVDKYKKGTESAAAATLFSGAVSDAKVQDMDTTKITANLGTAVDLNSDKAKLAMATALKMGTRVSTVDVKEEQSSASSTSNLASLTSAVASTTSNTLADAVKTANPNSDYFNDQTQAWVDGDTNESLGVVNEILCYLKNTGYADMLNYDNDRTDSDSSVNWYRAQIDHAKCEPAAASSSSSTDSSSASGTKPKYNDWIVKSERTDLDAVQTFDARLIEEEEVYGSDPIKVRIDVHTDITAGATENNPQGIFQANFLGLFQKDDGNWQTDANAFYGLISSSKDSSTGDIAIDLVDRYFNESQQGCNPQTLVGCSQSQEANIHLVRAKDGDGGAGSFVNTHYSDIDYTTLDETKTKKTNFVYNDDYFYQQIEGKDAICLDRNQFVNNVWRYGVYKTVDDTATSDVNEAGSRVQLEAGFPIKHELTAGGSYSGWASKWGIWLPSAAKNSDGTLKTGTTYKQSFDKDVAEQPITVVQGKGKLTKYTKGTTTLAELTGMPLQSWDNTLNQSVRVSWNGSSFDKTHEEVCANNRCNWKEVASATTYDISSPSWSTLNFWTNSGKDYRLELTCTGTPSNDNSWKHTGCSATDSSEVVSFSRETIYPDDSSVPTTLACMDRCPDASGNGNALNTISDLSNNGHIATNAGTTHYSYAWDKTAYSLKYGNDDVIISSGSNHIWSGALFEATTANLDKLKCDWNTDKYCSYLVEQNLDTFYRWESGANDWNKLSALKVAGTIKKFDDPKELTYRRTVASNTSNVMLQYEGFGNLWGIPGKCVKWNDPETEVECGSGENTRYIPEFSLAEGEELCEGSYTDGSCSGTKYIVKPLEMSQQMKQLDSTTACTTSGLTLKSYADKLKTISDWVNPDHETAGRTVPTITTAPSVIDGIKQ